MISFIHEDLFKKDSVKKDLVITDRSEVSLTNSDIYLESFELTEVLCDEEDLNFGLCNAASVKFTTSYLGELKGKSLYISVILNDDYENPFLFGVYKVFEDKLTADKRKKEIVAYDALYDVLNSNVIDWYNAILPNKESEVTLKQFRDSFFNYFNITQENIELVNDLITVKKTVGGAVLSGADVLKAICLVNACFGRINRNNHFEYFFLGDTEYEVGENGTYIKAYYEEYSTEPITKLIIRNFENDVGVTVGSGENVYIIENNFLLFGMGSDELTPIAENIYNLISNISFVPCTINVQGNPCFEIGDKIIVNLLNQRSIRSYILSRTYSGIQAQKEIYAANGLEKREEQVNSIDSKLIQLRGKSNELERTIEYTRSTIVDVERGLSNQITQTAEALEIEIERLQSEIDGEIEYFEREGEPTLLNYPYWDFTRSIPCNGTIKLDEIYNANMNVAESGEEVFYPHFTYTEEDRQEHLRDLVFDTTNAVSYRFNYETIDDEKVWYWQTIADSEISVILTQIAELKVTAAELESNYEEIDAQVTSQGLQIVTNTSNITQNARSINLEVARASEAEGSLQATLNTQADQIDAKVSKTGGNASTFQWKLLSDRFDLISNGSRVFRCNSAGIEINGNGTFSGTIESSEGHIGGWTISAAGIYKTNGNKTISLQSDGTFVCKQGNSVLWALQNDGAAVFHGNCIIDGSATINGYATASSLSAVDAKFNSLNADKITSGTLNAARIGSGSITADKIAAGSISADKIASGAITASKISGNAITADKINMNSLSGSDVYLGTMHSTNMFIWAGGYKFTIVQRSGDRYELQRSS